VEAVVEVAAAGADKSPRSNQNWSRNHLSERKWKSRKLPERAQPKVEDG